MILVEFRLDHPILRDALGRIPGTELTWVRSDATDGERICILVWADGDDLDAFDAALADDPTVARPTPLVDVGDRRLYRAELTDEGLRTSIYPLLVEEGGVVRELTADHRGWSFRVAFPGRESVDRFFDFCADHGIDADLYRLYEESTSAPGSSYGLTDSQREALIAAVDSGYFEIPRESSLDELGERLGISGNAASERVRRAMSALVEHTIYPERSQGVD